MFTCSSQTPDSGTFSGPEVRKFAPSPVCTRYFPGASGGKDTFPSNGTFISETFLSPANTCSFMFAGSEPLEMFTCTWQVRGSDLEPKDEVETNSRIAKRTTQRIAGALA